MGNVGALPQVWETHMVEQALLVIFDFYHALFPHSGRMVKIPRQGTDFAAGFPPASQSFKNKKHSKNARRAIKHGGRCFWKNYLLSFLAK